MVRVGKGRRFGWGRRVRNPLDTHAEEEEGQKNRPVLSCKWESRFDE